MPVAATVGSSASVGDLLLEFGERAVLQFRRAAVVRRPLRLLDLGARLLDLLLEAAPPVDAVLLLRPLRPQGVAPLADLGQFALQISPSRSCERRSRSFLQGFALDLQLRPAPLDFVQRRRAGFDLQPQLRRRLVHQVNRLVRQEAVGDVAVGERRRRDERRVVNLHAVMHLVPLAQAAQDRDRVLDARLADLHRLEAAFECGVLLDVLAVLIERRRADGVQFAARQGGLEQVRGVHRAVVAAPRPRRRCAVRQ